MIDLKKTMDGLENIRDVCNAKSDMSIGDGKIAWAGYAKTIDDALTLLDEKEVRLCKGRYYSNVFDAAYNAGRRKKAQEQMLWHRMDWDKYLGLEDRSYYLVTIPKFGTPMKAKWYDEGYWKVYGIDSADANKYVWPFDRDDFQVIAWMDLPEVYKEGR